jgi:hypothetical protein
MRTRIYRDGRAYIYICGTTEADRVSRLHRPCLARQTLLLCRSLLEDFRATIKSSEAAGFLGIFRRVRNLHVTTRIRILYSFAHFSCHGSQGPKFKKIFEPVTGHRGHFRICETSHKINGKWLKKPNFCVQRVTMLDTLLPLI